MKRWLFGFALLWVFSVVTAQDAAVFTLVSPDPVVQHGASQEWDGLYTDSGAVLYHDGQYHMFRNGFRGWPAEVQIGYLTSPDGQVWTEASTDPVLHSADVPYAGLAALASSAVVLDDGTWALYFYTWETHGYSGPSQIGLATAASPLGPWTVDAEPVLTRGAKGSWDSEQVISPRVIRSDDGYVMYYVGSSDKRTKTALGLATSPDGVVWTKYNDPSSDGTYAESDPVYQTDDPARFMQHGTTLKTADGWLFIYRSAGNNSPDRTMDVRYAFSADGLHWQVGAQNPLFGNKGMGGKGYWWLAALLVDDTLHLYIEADSRGGTDIFHAIYSGAVPTS